MSVTAPTRPMVRYHGGKWRLAPWIIAHMPEHRIYVEPFGGAASVLLRKPRSYAEIYNDLDGEIVNLFRVARDNGPELKERLRMTPFAREEFLESYVPSLDPIEQARRTVVRSYQGFGSAAICGETSGFRANSNRSGTTPAHDWKNYPKAFPLIIERLRGVVIEQRPAVEVMTAHDSPDTLHYVDPPYVHSTRSEKKRSTVTRKAYRHEMSDQEHQQLAKFLEGLRGAVMVSGYPCALYDRIFSGWQRLERMARVDGAGARTEVLWLKPHRFN
jgi:DNA adenine methylase